MGGQKRGDVNSLLADFHILLNQFLACLQTFPVGFLGHFPGGYLCEVGLKGNPQESHEFGVQLRGFPYNYEADWDPP